MGFRYRLHVSTLPGKPDLVFPRLQKIIEIHGCFWHQHSGCIDSHIPKTRTEYWKSKLKRNQQRDKQNQRKLRRLGWQLQIIWECEIKAIDKLSVRLDKFLHKTNVGTNKKVARAKI
jgi:DNA mismatch endonuclease, patch repair protein